MTFPYRNVKLTDRTFPLVEAAKAQDYLAEGHARGKVVLTFDQYS